ncbi:helix-turn-helix domain-containing protein [Haladaptatus sp. NG-WS-4]
MRYATITITPDDGGLHPADWKLYTDPDVTRESIREINLLNDGTCVVLYELRGDFHKVDELLSSHPDIIAVDVSDSEGGLVYVHFETNFTVEALLTIVQMHEIVLDTPIECIERGGVRVRLVGDDSTLQSAIGKIPDPLVISLESNGDYHAAIDDSYTKLTDRQREILVEAVEAGYYRVPRQSTHEHIATSLNLNPSTVGEHLRKIESHIFSELVTIGTKT